MLCVKTQRNHYFSKSGGQIPPPCPPQVTSLPTIHYRNQLQKYLKLQVQAKRERHQNTAYCIIQLIMLTKTKLVSQAMRTLANKEIIIGTSGGSSYGPMREGGLPNLPPPTPYCRKFGAPLWKF